MASVKTVRNIFDAQVIVAATPTTGTAVDVADGFGGVLNARITNGATAPTVAGFLTIEASHDNVKFYHLFGPLQGPTANNGVETWGGLPFDIGIKHLRAIADGNDDQTVTVEVYATEVESL